MLDVDDGERVIITDKIYGALLITTIRALESAGTFNEENIPNLEVCLELIADWGDAFGTDLRSKYPKVIKGLGKTLFGTRTEEERKSMGEKKTKAYDEFVKNLSDEEREKRGDISPGEEEDDEEEDEDEDEDEDEKKEKGPWYGKAKAADASFSHSSFKFTPIWREYKK